MSRSVAPTSRIALFRRANPALLCWAGLFAVALAVFATASVLRLGDLSPRFSESFLAYGLLPRGAFALLAGAALGLSGALLQRVLRNPAADASTLGIGSGAQLALGAATLFFPALLAEGRFLVAFLGGSGALLVVLALARLREYDPVTTVLCGLVVSLVCGALSATLILYGGDYMLSLHLWGGGTISQSGWRDSSLLFGALIAAILAALLLSRPLTLLGLSDESARGLGAGVGLVRLSVIAIATGLAATVTAAVGIIGFIGLMAANLARLSGARTVNAQLLAAPLMGAVLLFATDAAVLLFETLTTTSLATGAVTALLGGPLLLWLLPRLAHRAGPALSVPVRDIAHRRLALALLLAAIPAAFVLSLVLKPAMDGILLDLAAIEALSPLRWPRLLAGASAGAMLALAGTLLQRLTGNPVASPEVLGISSGAGLGLAVLLLFAPFAGTGPAFAATFAGSLLSLAAILVFARAAGLGPERLLLGGIAVASLAGAGVTLVMARGGPEASRLLDWMSGSTARVGPGLALAEAAILLVLLPLALLAHRWLSLLALGTPTARGLGLSPERAGSALITLAAVLTAAATLAVGPLSFVGLMAPHLARVAGFRRPADQLLAAPLIGALLMIVTDTAARSLAFPYQLPTGLFAALLGGPYLVVMISRQRR
ncbi:Fe(3+)-hydroxamate ABC transporter permease FhuB [Fulvimarina endophytica]|uniref:Fe(3+)-hydroxamate ABC transporter permease FhuB n=1 Tax=Fulvimarina endophytica TaxID=2293836 RepID=UPI0013144572|nr:Fe(3+)-hydroxamate ABC transporter permease FhuB [Fulvimarina endophytica]